MLALFLYWSYVFYRQMFSKNLKVLMKVVIGLRSTHAFNQYPMYSNPSSFADVEKLWSLKGVKTHAVPLEVHKYHKGKRGSPSDAFS